MSLLTHTRDSFVDSVQKKEEKNLTREKKLFFRNQNDNEKSFDDEKSICDCRLLLLDRCGE